MVMIRRSRRSKERKKRGKYSSKSGRLLDGRLFQQNKFENGIRYYKCATQNCRGTAFRDDAGPLQSRRRHSDHCFQDDDQKNLEILKEWMKLQCQTTCLKLSNIFKNSEVLYPHAAVFLTYKGMKSTMRRWRKEVYPTNPPSMHHWANDIETGKYNNIILGNPEETVKVETIEDTEGKCHLFFYNEDFVKKYGNSLSHMYLDGTFKITPCVQGAQQVFNIVGVVSGHAVLFGSAVMTSKTTEAYESVLKFFKSLTPNAKMKILMSDFEWGIRKAEEIVYPNARRVGCNCHFDRAICKLVKKSHFKDEDVMETLRKILALAFLPPIDIEQEFERQVSVMNPNIKLILKNVIKRIRNYWIKVIKPENWSVYGLDVRTNNNSESLNSWMSKDIGKRPTAIEFSLAVKNMLYTMTMQVARLDRGKSTSRLPRFQTMYKQKELIQQWRLLEHGEEVNYTIERFIDAVAKLKGNVKYLVERDSMLILPDSVGDITEEEEQQEWPDLCIRDDPDFNHDIYLSQNDVNLRDGMTRRQKRRERREERMRILDGLPPDANIDDFNNEQEIIFEQEREQRYDSGVSEFGNDSSFSDNHDEMISDENRIRRPHFYKNPSVSDVELENIEISNDRYIREHRLNSTMETNNENNPIDPPSTIHSVTRESISSENTNNPYVPGDELDNIEISNDRYVKEKHRLNSTMEANHEDNPNDPPSTIHNVATESISRENINKNIANHCNNKNSLNSNGRIEKKKKVPNQRQRRKLKMLRAQAEKMTSET